MFNRIHRICFTPFFQTPPPMIQFIKFKHLFFPTITFATDRNPMPHWGPMGPMGPPRFRSQPHTPGDELRGSAEAKIHRAMRQLRGLDVGIVPGPHRDAQLVGHALVLADVAVRHRAPT
jgi:hypothetical protein